MLRKLEKVAERMQMAFTGLTSLSLWSDKGPTPTLPKKFLAPRLRDISLVGVAFPGLPQLLASTTDLVSLHLLEVPDDGYIPPDVIATCLSTPAPISGPSVLISTPHFRLVTLEGDTDASRPR